MSLRTKVLNHTKPTYITRNHHRAAKEAPKQLLRSQTSNSIFSAQVLPLVAQRLIFKVKHGCSDRLKVFGYSWIGLLFDSDPFGGWKKAKQLWTLRYFCSKWEYKYWKDVFILGRLWEHVANDVRFGTILRWPPKIWKKSLTVSSSIQWGKPSHGMDVEYTRMDGNNGVMDNNNGIMDVKICRS